MRDIKGKNLTDRLENQAKARQAMIEKLKQRPSLDAPEMIALREKHLALAEARELRKAERQAAREQAAREEAERLALEQAEREEQARLAAEAEAKRRAEIAAEQKAARDARYAARKKRKHEGLGRVKLTK